MLLFFFKPSRSSDGSIPPIPDEPVRGGKKPIEFSYAAYKKYQKILRDKYEKKAKVSTPLPVESPAPVEKQEESLPLPEQIFEAAKLLSSEPPKDYTLELLLKKLEGLERLQQLSALANERKLREELFVMAQYERLKQQTEEAHRKLLLLLLQDE